MLAFLDIETHSLCDLRAFGGRIYAEHPSTRLMCACVYTDRYLLWTPTPCRVQWPIGLPEERFEHVVSDTCPWDLSAYTTVAHNGDDFDFRVWRAMGLKLGDTLDTLPLARAAGYPGALDALSKLFLGIGKNETASRMLGKLCKLATPPPPGPLAVIASYNIADVVALRRIYEKVKDFAEEPLYSVHKAINDRGVLFDRGFAGHVLRLSNENVDRAGRTIESLTDGYLRPSDLTKRNRVLEWVRRQGFKLDNLRRDTIEHMLDDPDAFLEESHDGEPEEFCGEIR